MTTRTDVTIDFEVSPRLIQVAAPSAEITIQDLVDTVRVIEDQLLNLDNDHIVDAAGKEQLGGGVQVGITATLRNAQISFEARGGPTWEQMVVSGGNVVSVDTDLVTPISPIDNTAFTQVVITASSSATLQEASELRFSSYQNHVWIDVLSATSGTTYPAGTRADPVNNLDDAILIATEVGLDRFGVIGDLTIVDQDVSKMSFIGQNALLTTINIMTAATVTNVEINEATITGVLDGGIVIRACVLGTTSVIDGFIFQTAFSDGVTVTLGATSIANFLDCFSGTPGLGTPIIDMNGSGSSLAMRGYSGGIEVINKTGPESVTIDLNSGQVILANTVTQGVIAIRGVGALTDGSTGTTIVNTDGLLNQPLIAGAVWDEPTGTPVVGSYGEWVRKKLLTTVKFLGLK